MPKNKIQFQRGQSLPQFLALYGTVAQCEQAVFAARWPHGFRCPQCGYHKSCQLRQRKVLQCMQIPADCERSFRIIVNGDSELS